MVQSNGSKRVARKKKKIIKTRIERAEDREAERVRSLEKKKCGADGESVRIR